MIRGSPTLSPVARLAPYDTLGNHGILGNVYAPNGGFSDSPLAGGNLLAEERVTVLPVLAPTFQPPVAANIPQEFGGFVGGDGAPGSVGGDIGEGAPSSGEGGGSGGGDAGDAGDAGDGGVGDGTGGGATGGAGATI